MRDCRSSEEGSLLDCLVVLYFTAAWCGPCRFMAPVYESLAGKYPGRCGREVGHQQCASLLLLKDGKEVDRVVGATRLGLRGRLRCIPVSNNEEKCENF
ncbi:unnamed protein product [Spirodela intermedia]|uniref:Thioredoxin domain-containing protein n=1 Tax=Spirodela intermedia TaxID=51605 RepID=A0A7I8IND5_SPIIN|nr:unnamed protein product [Spirodela intermedia]CAA6659388.1 unnamed protein product [Spirodela intermedia]